MVAELASKYKVKTMVVLVYHPYANGMIECKYKPIIYILLKILDESFTNWVKNLSTVFYADLLIVPILTSWTLYYVGYDNKPILIIELEISIWQILTWDKVYSNSNLLAIYPR